MFTINYYYNLDSWCVLDEENNIIMECATEAQAKKALSGLNKSDVPLLSALLSFGFNKR